MDTIFGLPAHPLATHAPVVLIPLIAIVAIVLAAKPDWRRGLGWWFVGAAVVVFAATTFATLTGEPFHERLGEVAPIRKHRQLGETTRLLTFVLVLAAVAVAVSDRLAARAITAQAAMAGRSATVAMVLGVVVSLLATVWVIRTGHEGARLVWDQ